MTDAIRSDLAAAAVAVSASVAQGRESGRRTNDARAREAADEFETMAIGEMLQPIFDTVDDSDGMFGGGSAERMFRPMIVQELAKSVQRSGGLGLSDAICREMLAAQEGKR